MIDLHQAKREATDRRIAELLALPGMVNSQELRGVLITGGARHNLPKQEHVTNGRFTVKESSFLRDGETHVRFTTYVTQKGLEWLRRELGKVVAA